PALGGWGHLADGSGWQPWAWGFLAGSFNAMSGLLLYRAFEIGKMAVVAPLSASYPALTLLLSWMTGERVSTVRIVGILCTLAGVVVVAGGEKTPDENDAEAVQRSGRGIGWAVFAAVGFAVLFWLLGTRVIPSVGAIQTVWMIRLTSALLTAAVVLISKQPMQLPHDEVRWMVLSMGAFDTGAFVLSNLGMKMEQVAVVTVLSSLYGAVTVGFAAIFLKERVSRWQWIGIVTIFVGIFLISR
ncbi:MAG: hypothetical protein DMG49_14045, partial [Acidobacteria bacterium]